jgi:hypothetical protein
MIELRIMDEGHTCLLVPLGNSQQETSRFYHPPIDSTVDEIMREIAYQPRRPLNLAGEQLGVLSAPQADEPEVPPAVVAALKQLATVNRVNSEIKSLRKRGLGLAQEMPYLTLWSQHVETINSWRRKHGLAPVGK